LLSFAGPLSALVGAPFLLLLSAAEAVRPWAERRAAA